MYYYLLFINNKRTMKNAMIFYHFFSSF